ncbi:P-loop NTPase fold protein [Pseudomonas sp. NPDC086251]|uniref:KAP family P-loop NTPase fold protein n=1 Tax=Pseudomonas sp. NPDC086251 TaxID=3364431 RepID=UPI003838C49B
MKIVIPPIEIKEGEGFGPDLFGREPFAKSLTNVIRQNNDPLVIGIHGSWGEGKTTFVKSWQNLLNQNHIPNIYIDAFASDYVDDAFMVVAGAISDYMQERCPADKSEAFVEKAKSVGAHLLSVGTKVAIRVASAGLANADDFKDFDKALEGTGDDIGKSAEKFIKERLLNHKRELASVEQFKEFLSTVPSALSSQSDHPLTVIIDELDRCRPSFAVEMLEKIKHLFSVKNVTFILVINKIQLEESIRATYGLT